MQKLTIALIVIVLAVIGGGAYVVFSNADKTNKSKNQATQQAENQSINGNIDIPLTLAEVKKHNTASDCWTVIDNQVFNLTSYISQHPGGNDILRACGTDGTEAFKTQGGSGSHSSAAAMQLQSLLLGDLE